MYTPQTNHWLKHIDFIILDSICLFVSLWMAVSVRTNASMLFTYSRYNEMLLLVFVLHIFYIAAFKPYSGILWRPNDAEFRSIIKHIGFIIAGFLFYNYLLKQVHYYSRIIIVLFIFFSIFFITCERFIIKDIIKGSDKNWKKDILLASSSMDAANILAQINSRPLGFKVAGIVLFDDFEETQIDGIPIVARNIDEVTELIESTPIDEVILSKPDSKSFYAQLLETCTEYGLTTHILIKYSNLPGEKSLDKVANLDVITNCMKLVSGTDVFFKRVLDIIGAIVGLFITAILFIIFAPLIYLSDPGSVFFKQPRIGENGRVFYLYKFRSMYKDAEEKKASLMEHNEMQGQIFKMENDPRIIGSGPDGTRKGIGWFIRTFSIDEFPQFLNVLKGEMSRVGTRPPTIDEWQQYASHHRKRMRVKPGITGLWQTSGRNEITDFEEIVKLDTQYISNWSFWLDIEILLKTIIVVLNRTGSK